jgi:nicotinamide riboside kinase
MKNRLNIAITGPESSGKTTIAKLLAEELNACYIPEFAREYLENLDRSYTIKDLDEIAKGQVDRWKAAPKDKSLVCDTELVVVKIWSEFKYSKISYNIIELLDKQQFEFYFLCKPDIPWEPDALRENPDDRELLFEMYVKELKLKKWPFVILEGAIESRLKVAMEILDDLFTSEMN